jgi:tRNA (cytidine32/uridine32-2'-O)-methyltransferase
MGEKAVVEGQKYPIALVFGRENSGLSNEELQKCHFHVFIPANPDYSSLNLAMAVQTLSYEIRMAFLTANAYPKQEQEYPLTEEIEAMFNHLQQTLTDTRFIVPAHPGLVMTKLRRFFNRARPEIKELRMWRGIFSSIQKSLIAAKKHQQTESLANEAVENKKE